MVRATYSKVKNKTIQTDSKTFSAKEWIFNYDGFMCFFFKVHHRTNQTYRGFKNKQGYTQASGRFCPNPWWRCYLRVPVLLHYSRQRLRLRSERTDVQSCQMTQGPGQSYCETHFTRCTSIILVQTRKPQSHLVCLSSSAFVGFSPQLYFPPAPSTFFHSSYSI